MSEKIVQQLAKDLGGKVEEIAGPLPDGSGYAVVSFPLPDDHWLLKDDGFEAPPMPLRMGTDNPEREKWKNMLKEAGRYAIRTATMNGKEMDFDPDALVQNLVTGMLGYNTPDGLSEDDWANPAQPAEEESDE